MKLYDGGRAPNPRRVRIFLAEKGIEIDKQQAARWKLQKRTGDSLPKRAQAVVEQGRALATEAKGLGRLK